MPPTGRCCFGRCGVQGRGGVTRVRPSVSVSSGPAAVRSAPGHDQRAPLSLTATPVELCPRGSWPRSVRAAGPWLLPAPLRVWRRPSRPSRNRETGRHVGRPRRVRSRRDSRRYRAWVRSFEGVRSRSRCGPGWTGSARTRHSSRPARFLQIWLCPPHSHPERHRTHRHAGGIRWQLSRAPDRTGGLSI